MNNSQLAIDHNNITNLALTDRFEINERFPFSVGIAADFGFCDAYHELTDQEKLKLYNYEIHVGKEFTGVNYKA